MARETKKSKPIGVRFDLELLDEFKEKGIRTPQNVLSFLEINYKTETEANRELGKKLIDAAKGRDAPKTKKTKYIPPVNIQDRLPGESSLDYKLRMLEQ